MFITSAGDPQQIQDARNIIQDRWKNIGQSPLDLTRYPIVGGQSGRKPNPQQRPESPESKPSPAPVALPPDGHIEPEAEYEAPWAYKPTTPDDHPKKHSGYEGSPLGGTGDRDSGGSYKRMNATFVTLARNSDIWDIADSIKQVEDRFNWRYNYDWVFLNDEEFDDDFKRITTDLVSGTTKYGIIPEEHWSFPEWIDQDKAAEVRKDMGERKIIYGDSVSYRHMCRFESGFFFRQELMMEYEWYWRVEPSIKLYCDINYDTFKFMAENNKTYSFVLSLFEYQETIPTIWDSVRKFMKNHPEHLDKDNSMSFLSDDYGDTYNRCHFVSCKCFELYR